MLEKIRASLEYLTGIASRRWNLAHSGQSTVVLMYHRIDPAPSSHHPIPQAFGVERGVPVDAFERQIRFMLKHFEPREPTHLFSESSTKPGFTVTFDDGYADNLHLAAPILQRLNVPAAIFLNSDFIGTDQRFWWETLGAMIRESQLERLDVGAISDIGESHLWGQAESLPLTNESERARAHWSISQTLMRTPTPGVSTALQNLAHALSVPLRVEDRDWPLLNWDQVRTLTQLGFEIGAHGATHANLGLADPETVRQEVLQSITEIESQLQKKVRSFAYPYGGKEHRSTAALDALDEAGCPWAFTTESRAATRLDTPLAMPRAGLTGPGSLTCAYRIDRAYQSTATDPTAK